MRNPFRRQPDQPAQHDRAAPPPPLTSDQEEQAAEVARELVWPGFTDLLDLRYAVEEWLGEEGVDPPTASGAAERIARRAWDRRAAELAAAPGTGDHGRLTAAFEALSVQGVLGRMCFTCCQTCGTDEIGDERTPVDAPEGRYAYAEWAYTFFHGQDAERLVGAADGVAPLMLSYSSFRAAPDADPAVLAASRAGDAEARARLREETNRTVGHLVRDALVAQGLEVTWDGSVGQRIEVAITDWRKPLPVS